MKGNSAFYCVIFFKNLWNVQVIFIEYISPLWLLIRSMHAIWRPLSLRMMLLSYTGSYETWTQILVSIPPGLGLNTLKLWDVNATLHKDESIESCSKLEDSSPTRVVPLLGTPFLKCQVVLAFLCLLTERSLEYLAPLESRLLKPETSIFLSLFLSHDINMWHKGRWVQLAHLIKESLGLERTILQHR